MGPLVVVIGMRTVTFSSATREKLAGFTGILIRSVPGVFPIEMLCAKAGEQLEQELPIWRSPVVFKSAIEGPAGNRGIVNAPQPLEIEAEELMNEPQGAQFTGNAITGFCPQTVKS